MGSVIGRPEVPAAPKPRTGTSHAVVVELLGFVGMLVGILSAVWVAATAQLTFFNAPVVITEGHVRLYWMAVGLFAVSSVFALGAAIYRRAKYSPWFCLLLIVTGIAVAMLLSVNASDDVGPPTQQRAGGVGCDPSGDGYSCPGG